MFYEKEEIENELLKCPSCLHIYDTPYILPCGEMICNRCLFKLTDNGHSKRISCPFCKGIHVVPHDGFLVHKRLANMLNRKPKKIFRGVEFERTEKMLDEIKVIINEFYKSIGDVKANFKNYCDDLRDAIEHDTNLAIEEHEINKQKLVGDIDLYERKCIEAMQHESRIQKSYSMFLQESNEKIEHWYDRLNRADLTKSDLDGVLNEALNLRVCIMTEMDVISNLFKDKLLKYYKHERDANSTHFGKLYYEEEEKNRERKQALAKFKEQQQLQQQQEAEDEEEETREERYFPTFKDFLSTLLSPVASISFPIVNFVTSELENINNKFQETLLNMFTSIYTIYTKS